MGQIRARCGRSGHVRWLKPNIESQCYGRSEQITRCKLEYPMSDSSSKSTTSIFMRVVTKIC